MAAEGCPAWQLEDVQRWLREQEGGPAWQLKEVQRIREAVALLWPPDVQALQDVQFYCGRSVVEPLQTEWKVSPKKDGTKKLVREVREELRSKVCEAAQRLQQQGPDEPAAAADPVPSRRSSVKRSRKRATEKYGERGDELQRPSSFLQLIEFALAFLLLKPHCILERRKGGRGGRRLTTRRD